MKSLLGLMGFIAMIPWGNFASASTLTYWSATSYGATTGYTSTRHPEHISACMSLIGTPPQSWLWSPVISKKAANMYDCHRAYHAAYCPLCGTEYKGYALLINEICQHGHKGLECNGAPPTCIYGTFNPSSNQCVSDSDKGQPPESCTVSGSASSANELTQFAGNPINFLTGNKFHQENYFRAAQQGGIIFKRMYNSADAVWRHSYSDRLQFNGDHILLIFSDGKTLRYSLAGDPLDSAAERFGVLNSSGGGWRFTTKSQASYIFDTQGRLLRIEFSNGQSHRMNYVSISSSTQVFVSDDFGNQIDFKVNATGGLYAFTAPGITMSFIRDSSGRLLQDTKTFNGQQVARQYHYEDPRNMLLLTGVTDERGVRYASWTYDIQGRAISSQHTGGADKVLISYDSDLSSTVTNELGKKTTYRFEVIDGSKRITAIEGQPSANCPNSNSTFTYDSRGLLISKTDNKGNVTTFDYDTRGLEVSRTEAYGTTAARTITTEWHPSLFLPLVVTEPNRINRYQYDGQGRQLSRTVDAL